MHADVSQFVKQCATCAIHRRLRANPSNATINMPEIGGFRFDTVQVDVKELPHCWNERGDSLKKV